MATLSIALTAVVLLTSNPASWTQTPASSLQQAAPPARSRAQTPARPRNRAETPPEKPIEVLPPATQPPPDPTPAPTDNSRHTVVTDDGAIETTLPDGRKRITRPGSCGSTTIMLDGTRRTTSCLQAQPPTQPLPPATDANVRWLDTHSAGLLTIVQSLLGNDQASVGNYLRNHETDQQTVYDKIWIRTDMILKLTDPN